MKRVRRILALVLCAALLLSMAGCAQKPAETTAPPTTQAPTTVPTEPPAEDIYAAARVALDHASHLTMEVVITTVTEVAGDAFSQKSVQTLTYKDLDTEEGVIVCEEDLTFSVHDDELDPDTSDPTAFREVWYQGNLYVEMDSTYRYRGPLEKDAAVSRYVPAVLLNAELYGTLTAETTAEGTCLTFGEASAAENWALPEEGELLEAGGTALVSADGVLTEMTYTVVYQNGPARVTKTVVAKPQATPRTVTAPANPDTYTDLTYVDALRLNVQIPYLLVQTDSAAVVSIESLFSQAAGFLRNQNTTTNLQGRDSDTKAKIETGVYVMDYSSMQDQKYDLEETYINGQLTTVENDGLPSTSSGITWEDMRLYVTEQILAELVDWSYWDDATMTDLGSVMYLEYDLTENFGNTIQNSICQMLWDDPSFLIALADDYRNEEINGYLSVDKYTGLPVATGYYYKGVHTIEGQDYALTLQYDQTFESPAKGAYQEITDEMPAEAEPAVDVAKALYAYHVAMKAFFG